MKLYETEKALLNGMIEHKIYIPMGGRTNGKNLQLTLINEVFRLTHEIRALNKGLRRKNAQIRKWKAIAYDYYEKYNDVILGEDVKII